MGKRIFLTDQQEDWLRANHSKLSHQQSADELGCCVDTLKRLLMRRKLQNFPGAKYQFREAPKQWSRPCSSCGCIKPRAKFQYRCATCHDGECEDVFDVTTFQYAYATSSLKTPTSFGQPTSFGASAYKGKYG